MNPLLIPAIVNGVTNIIDSLVTTDKEKLDAQIELGKLQLEGQKVEAGLLQGQIDVNKEEAKHTSIFVAGWRPAVGWACVGGLVYQLLMRPLLGWVATNLWGWSEPPTLDFDTLMTLLFGMLGLGGYRTFEKFKKVDK